MANISVLNTTSKQPRIRNLAHMESSQDPCGVWDPTRFKFVKNLQRATERRNKVELMHDSHSEKLCTVKTIPMTVKGVESAEAWTQDVACTTFLKTHGFTHLCEMIGTFWDSTHTYIVQAFGAEGDLFDWCLNGLEVGLAWEQAVRPVARQMFQAVRNMHEIGVVHRDLSLQNVVLTKHRNDLVRIGLMDFGMASMCRHFQACPKGKASYVAPEMLDGSATVDAFLSDAFALGVTLYAAVMREYPWTSTEPGACQCFDYFRRHGFRAFLAKKNGKRENKNDICKMSEPLVELLAGLLAFSPDDRLTLGESSWGKGQSHRKSVWDLDWLNDPSDSE